MQQEQGGARTPAVVGTAWGHQGCQDLPCSGQGLACMRLWEGLHPVRARQHWARQTCTVSFEDPAWAAGHKETQDRSHPLPSKPYLSALPRAPESPALARDTTSPPNKTHPAAPRQASSHHTAKPAHSQTCFLHCPMGRGIPECSSPTPSIDSSRNPRPAHCGALPIPWLKPHPF